MSSAFKGQTGKSVLPCSRFALIAGNMAPQADCPLGDPAMPALPAEGQTRKSVLLAGCVPIGKLKGYYAAAMAITVKLQDVVNVPVHGVPVYC
jgi:hypothetical protein